MNPNEFYKNDPEKKWKIFCYRFIGRSRRLERFKELHGPEFIIENEKKLIQKAYEEMREGCLTDPEYLLYWEHKEENKKEKNENKKRIRK